MINLYSLIPHQEDPKSQSLLHRLYIEPSSTWTPDWVLGTDTKTISLVPSKFGNRPDTIAIAYLPQSMKKPREEELSPTANLGKFRISPESVKYDTLLNTLGYSGLLQSESRQVSLFWTSLPLKKEECKLIRPETWVNHFPGSQYLGRKDLLH